MGSPREGFGIELPPAAHGLAYGPVSGRVCSLIRDSLLSDTCIVMYRDVFKHVFRERTLNTSQYERDTCIAHDLGERWNWLF